MLLMGVFIASNSISTVSKRNYSKTKVLLFIKNFFKQMFNLILKPYRCK